MRRSRLAAGSNLAIILAAAVPLWPGAASTCTTFLLSAGRDSAEVLVGKSYDWSMGQGLVFVNKRGVSKQALTLRSEDKPARWISKFASLTFNQYGREFPSGGMNEAGLVVEIMWLDSSVFPAPDDRPSMTELQFVQYLLDGFRSVPEVVAGAPAVRVSLAYGKVHYLVCDRSGAGAALEYIDGKLVITTGVRMPVKTLTNSTYAQSRAHLAGYARFGGATPFPRGRSSLERFVRASWLAGPTAGRATDVPGRAFAVLDSVSQGEHSQWNIVYAPQRLRVYFRTQTNTRIKHVDLTTFDLSCKAPVRTLDIDADLEGDVGTSFQDYRATANEDLVRRSFASIADKFPQGVVAALARYPEALQCAPPAP